MTHLLETGATYSATLSLGIIDRMASNDQVKEKFESVGFIEVSVDGSGKHRTVKGKWVGKTEEHLVPDQIDSIQKL